MEATGDGTVETEDPHEWNSEKVDTFVRSLRTTECFQSGGDQVSQCWSLEWMTVFSAHYPSTPSKVCVHMFGV